MLSFLRFCLGISFWAYLLQLSSVASELADVKQQAGYLPDRLSQSSQPNWLNGSDKSSYLITQEREGATQKFTIPPNGKFQPSIPIEEVEAVEVVADRQEYDQKRGMIIATGNVVMRFAQSVITSDRLEIDLNKRLAVAKDNVALQRGEQVLRGARFEYYFVADRGVVYDAGGEIYQPSLNQDTDLQLAPNQTIFDRGLSDRKRDNQPLSNVTNPGGINTTVGSSRIDLLDRQDTPGGTINRLRFEADRLDFESNTWTAKNLSLTNDPFSPPELELRAKTATYEQIDALQGKLTTAKSSLVIDDSFKIPLLAAGFTFDGRSRRPGLFSIGFDGDERGGLFVERTWNLINQERYSWNITPQYFLQRAISPTTFRFSDEDDGGIFNADVFGVTSRISANLSPRTDFTTNVDLTSLDFNDLENNLRARVELVQTAGKLDNPYKFAFEYNFRDRLFNGSLGFQTVRNSIGGVVTSPQIALGNTGVVIRYQGSIQNIDADTDRLDLLPEGKDIGRINLTRYQAAVFVDKNFSLWRGKGLPSTKDQGLRYSPSPVIPYVELFTGASGVSSLYSNDESQLSLEGNLGIRGQLGHFSRSWLDYTGFKISYTENLRGDESPFRFDRIVDTQILTLGINQQIYGSILFGWQTSINLDNNDTISSDYTLEYSRRTHNITLRYNPILEVGSISLRISDFNWQGNSQPFRDEGITPVIQGVER
jgi:lipopolysaccharide export system protein LptA